MRYQKGYNIQENLDFKKIDYFIVGLYLILGFIIFYAHYFQLFPQPLINKALLFFGLGSPYLLYGLYYKRLRSKEVMIAWSIISMVQIAILIIFKDLNDFKSDIGKSYLDYLIGLPYFLSTHSMLRFVYLKIYGQEWIVTGLHMSTDEIEDARKIRKFDFVLSAIGAFFLILGIPLVTDLIN